MLIASLVFGLRAATDLWEKGYKGGRATVNGIVLAVLLLVPFGVQLVNALENPQLNDVATDVLNPPGFLKPVGDNGQPQAVAPPYDSYTARQIVTSYPELVARRYIAPPERVAFGVQEVLQQWGWAVVDSRNVPEEEVDEPQEDGTQSDNAELAGDQEELAKVTENGTNGSLPEILFQVRAQSFVMKLQSHLVIRLTSTLEGTLVDVRSASNWGRHDFGSNARNISQFLTALDENLAGLAGEV